MRLLDWWREGHPLVNRWAHDDKFNLTWVGHTANAYHRWTRWVKPWFWAHIWRAPQHYSPHAPKAERWPREWRDLNPWEVRWCRLRGHPGIIYYSSGCEPDTRCARCYEEIG